ncbi:MAG: SGNH/GDSL hydrolase family protein [Dehalococcoidia bacterium]
MRKVTAIMAAAVVVLLLAAACGDGGGEPTTTPTTTPTSALTATLTPEPTPRGGAQPAATYLSLGDSRATSVGASDPLSTGYVPLVHQQLQESDRYKDRELELVNLGVTVGESSATMLRPGGQLEKALAKIQGRTDDKPVEIITLAIGGPTLERIIDRGPCPADPFGEACLVRAMELLAEYEQNLRQALKALREAAPKANIVVLGAHNPRVGTSQELVDFGVQQLNGVMARVAGEEQIGAKMADPFALFQPRPASEVLALDKVHPNDAGYALLAEVVMAALEEC